MSDERWVVQRESPFLYDVWHHVGPLYVSEEVAYLAIKYVWTAHASPSTFRVRRVS